MKKGLSSAREDRTKSAAASAMASGLWPASSIDTVSKETSFAYAKPVCCLTSAEMHPCFRKGFHVRRNSGSSNSSGVGTMPPVTLQARIMESTKKRRGAR